MATRPSKRRRLTPPLSDDEGSAVKSKRVKKAFFKNAAGWDLEQDYENRPRKGKKKERESQRLPVKDTSGRVQQLEDDDVESVHSDADWLEGGGDADAGAAAADRHKQDEESHLPEHEQILIAKEDMAKIATQLTENPEEHPGAFKALAKIGESKIVAIQIICLVTQMAIYKDVIPGYRIRPSSEDPKNEKLSKEVKTLRVYEQSLVAGYQEYLKKLAKLAKSPPAASRGPQNVSNIAVTCACTLATAVPHFNFRTELLKILVGKLSFRKFDDSSIKCKEALATLFSEDEEGRPSMEAVSLLSKMMKVREYQVDESAVNLFLHLRLLSEFSGKASQDQADGSTAVNPRGKRGKDKKEFRTKKERKLLKEQKSLQKDMDHADALVSHEEKEKMQSETLKLVFATYFRILKLRLPHLMGAVLEGLAKYAHLINQDFFGDLLEALKDLVRYSDGDEARGGAVDGEEEEPEEEPVARNPSREALLCTVTAFALLAGQDAHNARADLHLDLSFFTTHLFRSLFPLAMNPDLELGARSLHLPGPDSRTPGNSRSNKVNIQTTTVLLIRCLTAILLPPWNIRSVPPTRLAAFSKQLMTASLHVPEKSCQAALALLNDITHTHSQKIVALWNTEERKGDGRFNPLSDSVEGSNPFATTVWEGEILRKHYCPKVREGVKLLEKRLRE